MSTATAVSASCLRPRAAGPRACPRGDLDTQPGRPGSGRPARPGLVCTVPWSLPRWTPSRPQAGRSLEERRHAPSRLAPEWLLGRDTCHGASADPDVVTARRPRAPTPGHGGKEQDGTGNGEHADVLAGPSSGSR